MSYSSSSSSSTVRVLMSLIDARSRRQTKLHGEHHIHARNHKHVAPHIGYELLIDASGKDIGQNKYLVIGAKLFEHRGNLRLERPLIDVGANNVKIAFGTQEFKRVEKPLGKPVMRCEHDVSHKLSP